MRKNKDWMAQNQDNVFEWGEISTRGLFFLLQLIWTMLQFTHRGHPGRDRMVVGFTTTYAISYEFKFRSDDAELSDKVCQ